MRNTFHIARRELAIHFDSLMAYLLLGTFLAVSGFFTWWFGNDVFMRGVADLGTFFHTAFWTLFFLVPAVTMRSLSEERASGTLDLLLSKAVKPAEIVGGKFLATLSLVLLALAGTLPYWYTVARLGAMDHGATACGYLGLCAMGAAYVAIGLFASSLSRHALSAFLLAISIIAVLHMGASVVAENTTGTLARVMDQLSTGSHFASLGRGVIDLRDMVHFASITALALWLTTRNLQRGTT